MRTTSSINFYCRKSKATKKGIAPIEISIIINSKRVFINLPRKERPSVFSKEIKRRDSELNSYLDTIRAKLNEAQTDLARNGLAVTANNLRTYLKSGGIKTYTVGDMFYKYLQLLKKRVGVDLSSRTYEKYLTVQKEFEGYFGKDTEVSTITEGDMKTYYAELNTRFKSSTSTGKMRKIKSVFRFSFENGLIPTFPFSTIRIERERPLKEYLTQSELDSICNAEYPTERLRTAADLFVFQASCGLSYADMINLSEKDIQCFQGSYFIHKRRVKTGVEYTAVILPMGMDILKKYNYKLPSLCNQNYNVLLKLVGEICRIDKNIHSHLARKTYATMLLNSGVPITSVSKALGHSDIKTTVKYYSKTFDSTVISDISKTYGNEKPTLSER